MRVTERAELCKHAGENGYHRHIKLTPMNVSTNETIQIDQGEDVELYDVIQVLCKRKKLIIGGTLICMLVTGIAAFVLPPVYRVSAIIEVGQIIRPGMVGIRRAEPIEKPGSLVEKIKGGVYDEIIREKLGLKESQYPQIKTRNPRNTPLVQISIDYSDKQNALRILEHLVEQIVKDHDEISSVLKFDLENTVLDNQNALALIDKDEASTKEQLLMNKEQKNELQEQILELQRRITELERQKPLTGSKSNPGDALTLLLLSNELRETRRHLNDLQDRLRFVLPQGASALRDKLNSLASRKQALLLDNEKLSVHLNALRNTRIAKKPSNSEMPVRPRKGLNIVLGGLAGILGFVFLAFFLEYLQGASAARRGEDASA